MTHITCPGCQLRFARAVAASLPSCPFCDGPLTSVEATRTIGYQLVERVVPALEMPEAVSAVLPVPRPPAGHDGG